MANYTYTINSITGAVGTTAGTQTVTATLSPKSGYRLISSDFSINNPTGLENVSITQQGANVVITFDLVDTILYTGEDIDIDIDINGDARSSFIRFDGDLDIDNSPDDGFVIIIRDIDGDIPNDATLEIDIDGTEGDQVGVGVLVITVDEGKDLPNDEDGSPLPLDVDLPSPYSLGDGVLNSDGEWEFNIIVTIPSDDTSNGETTVSTEDIQSGGETVVASDIEGFTDNPDLQIFSIDIDTSNLDGLNGGFVVVTATGDPGASGGFTLTPTVTPSTSSTSYSTITGDILINSIGAFRKVIRIPSAAGDSSAENEICDLDIPEDIDNVDWNFTVDTDDGTADIDDSITPDTIVQKTDSKITIRFYSDDNTIPQPLSGDAEINTYWAHDTVLGPSEFGNKSVGGTISLVIPPPDGRTWSLTGTPAEVAANLVKLKETEEIFLVGNSNPGIDFCRGTARIVDNNLTLFLEYSDGEFQGTDSLYQINLPLEIGYANPGVYLNFNNTDKYTFSQTSIGYQGVDGGAVSGTTLSVTATVADGYTWHDTDFAATVASFIADGHTQDNIASLTITPTIASLQNATFSGEATTDLTLSWTLQGVHGSAPAVYDFTPTGEPKAISFVDFNSNDLSTMSTSSIDAIEDVEGRSYSVNYTLTANTGKIFGDPHGVVASVDNSATITGPNPVGDAPHTELNGTITGTLQEYDTITNINVVGIAGTDTDGDGTLDEIDDDDDGDGVIDTEDEWPLDSTRSETIFNCSLTNVSSTNGEAIDTTVILNHTIDATIIPSGTGITFSIEGITTSTATSVPYSDGTTAIRIQCPASTGFDGSTAGTCTIRSAGQEDIVINITQTEEITTFTTTSSTTINHPSTGASSQTISVDTNNPSISWTAVSSDTSVVNITSGSSGTGSGVITYTAISNSFDEPATSCTITLSAPGQTDIVITIEIAQGETTTWSLASYAQDLPNDIDPSQLNYVSVSVNDPSVTWSAVSSDTSVVQITAGNTGTGSGNISFTATPNEAGQSSTSSNITVSSEGLPDLVYAVTVLAGAPATFSVSPSTLTIDSTSASGELSVATNVSTLNWQAVIGDTEIVDFENPLDNTVGPKIINLAADAILPFATAKSTNVTFSSENFNDIVITVNVPAGSTDDPFSVTPLNFEIANEGSTANTSSVLAAANQTWTAVSSDDTIVSITEGASGSGSDSIVFSAASNAGETTPKEATITVSSPGQRNEVINVSIAPIEQDELWALPSYVNIANTGAVGNTISVETNNSELEWTAVSSDSNIVNITTGASGTGNGTITYTATANSIGEDADSETITLSAAGVDDVVININIAEGDPSVTVEVYETGTTTSKVTHAFDNTTTSATMDVYVDSETGNGGFTSEIIGAGSTVNYNDFNFEVNTFLGQPAAEYFYISGNGAPWFPVAYEDRDAIDAKKDELNAAMLDPNVPVSITINGQTITSSNGSLGGHIRLSNGGPGELTIFGWDFRNIANEGDAVTISYPSTASADFSSTPTTGSDGTTTITVTPSTPNTTSEEKSATLRVTSVSDTDIYKEVELTQGVDFQNLTTINMEAVDFDPTNAPTSTPLKFRFTSNNATAGWRQYSLPAAFAEPDPVPEGAFILRGGSMANSPEFTFELPTPTTTGSETFNASFSAIRLQNIHGGAQYSDYLDTNGVSITDSLDITTAPLSWSVDENVFNIDNGGNAPGDVINLTINDRRLAWTGVSSDSRVVFLPEGGGQSVNTSGAGSTAISFYAHPNESGLPAYSATITLSAPNVPNIVITVNVAAGNPENFILTDGEIEQPQLSINPTGSNATITYASTGGAAAYVYPEGSWDNNLRDSAGNTLASTGTLQIATNPDRNISYEVQATRIVFLQVSENTKVSTETLGLKIRSSTGNTENTITLKQLGAQPTLDPSYLTKTISNVGSTGETIAVTTNNPGLEWTAVSSDSDVVSVTSGTGTGNGTITYDAVANGDNQPTTFATITLSAENAQTKVIGITINSGNILPATYAYFTHPNDENQSIHPFVYGRKTNSTGGAIGDTYVDGVISQMVLLGIKGNGKWYAWERSNVRWWNYLESDFREKGGYGLDVRGEFFEKVGVGVVWPYEPFEVNGVVRRPYWESFGLFYVSGSWYSNIKYAFGAAIASTPYFYATDNGVPFSQGATIVQSYGTWNTPISEPGRYGQTTTVTIPSGTIKKLRLHMGITTLNNLHLSYPNSTPIGYFVANESVYHAGQAIEGLPITLSQIGYGEVEITIDATNATPGSYGYSVRTFNYGMNFPINVT